MVLLFFSGLKDEMEKLSTQPSPPSVAAATAESEYEDDSSEDSEVPANGSGAKVLTPQSSAETSAPQAAETPAEIAPTPVDRPASATERTTSEATGQTEPPVLSTANSTPIGVRQQAEARADEGEPTLPVAEP